MDGVHSAITEGVQGALIHGFHSAIMEGVHGALIQGGP